MVLRKLHRERYWRSRCIWHRSYQKHERQYLAANIPHPWSSYMWRCIGAIGSPTRLACESYLS